MNFIIFNLLQNIPNPVTQEKLTTTELFDHVINQAVLAEALGFDGYGIGERHGTPFISSSPVTVLTAIAARTSKIRLYSTVTVLSVLDPVRVAEDYALLDHLSKGRLEVMIGKGADPRHYPLFDVKEEEQWDALAEKYELLQRLWHEENVTWEGKFRTPLQNVTTEPRPYQKEIRIWHGSATSYVSTELAAKHGAPLFSSNGFQELEIYRDLINHYRERFAYYGHTDKEPEVGASCIALYIADTFEEAVEKFKPHYDKYIEHVKNSPQRLPFANIYEHIEGGSLLVGTPQGIVEKILKYHQHFGHHTQALSVSILPVAEQAEQLTRFAKEVMPEVHRRLASEKILVGMK